MYEYRILILIIILHHVLQYTNSRALIYCNAKQYTVYISYIETIHSHMTGNPDIRPSASPPSLAVYTVSDPPRVLITWGVLDCLQRNAPIRFYSLSVSQVGGQATGYLSTDTEIRLDLDFNREYSFRVAALNVNGLGPFSPTVRARPANVPTSMLKLIFLVIVHIYSGTSLNGHP